MTKFVWSKALDVEDEILNEEHRELIEGMAELQRLNRRLVPKQELLGRYSAFIGLVQNHFGYEEHFLREIGYPDFESHQRLHEQLLRSLNRYGEEFYRSTDGALPSAVFDFFQTWMTTHIMIADRRYAEFVRSQKEASVKRLGSWTATATGQDTLEQPVD